MAGPGDYDAAERRSAARYGMQSIVEVTLADETLEATSEDISTGGMRLRFVATEPSVGQTVTLKFSLPDLDDAIEVEAIVRWVNRVAGNICGVQFAAGLRAREVWAINRLNMP